MGVFSPGGSAPFTGTVSTSGNKKVRHVANYTLGAAATESTLIIPAGTAAFTLRIRGAGRLQIADTSGLSGTTFDTVRPYCSYSEEGLALASPISLFIQSNEAGSIVEFVWWT